MQITNPCRHGLIIVLLAGCSIPLSIDVIPTKESLASLVGLWRLDLKNTQVAPPDQPYSWRVTAEANLQFKPAGRLFSWSRDVPAEHTEYEFTVRNDFLWRRQLSRPPGFPIGDFAWFPARIRTVGPDILIVEEVSKYGVINRY